MLSDSRVSLQDVSFTYEEAPSPALSDISSAIRPGEFVAVLGHNGSGKSTMAKLINALYTPTKGTVLVCGYDTKNEEYIWKIRQHAGMIFQNPDNQIKLEATDNADSFMNAISWVADGRYDFAVWPKNYYEQLVVADGGDLHEYNDKLDFYDCRSVYTYPIISKDKPEVAEAISEVLGTLKDDGTLSELSQKFYGYDAFMYDTVKND